MKENAKETSTIKRYAIKEVLPAIRRIGRTFYSQEEQLLYTNWTCSGIEFCWQGSRLDVEFAAEYNWEIMGDPWDGNAPKRPNWPWFAVFIDDMDTPVLEFEVDRHRQVKSLVSDATEGELHQIRIIKRTENYKTWGAIAAILTDGSITAVPSASRKQIEFIGDSITCGFGVDTLDRDGPFYSKEENGLHNHGWQAAQLLNMEPSFVSVSGICVTRGKGLPNEYAMDELYDFTDKPGQRHMTDGQALRNLPDSELRQWDFTASPKDYVVLNLGTNDTTDIVFSEDKEAALENFRRGYSAFLRHLREKNGPDAQIICALGTLNYYLYADICQIVEAYRRETGDERVHTFRYMWGSPMDGFGACGHPSAATQKKMAMELAEFIREI